MSLSKILFLIFSLFIFSLHSPLLKAADRYVRCATTADDPSNNCSDRNNPCTRIQTAINQATAGENIYVGKGACEENLTINKNISIEGSYNFSRIFSNIISPTSLRGITPNTRAILVRDSIGHIVNLSKFRIHNTSGGGLYIAQNQRVILNNVEFEANETTENIGGAGIMNDGTLDFTNGSLIGNNSRESDGQGGGLLTGYFNDHARSILNNVTISNNSAVQGGGIYNKSHTALTNVTLFNNTGRQGQNIFTSGVVLFTNSIVGILPNTCEKIGSGVIQSQGGNLFSPETCYIDVAPPAGISDRLYSFTLPNSNTENSFTQLHSLTSGHPAINAALNDYCLETDQRGRPRAKTTEDPCDAGAYEFQNVRAEDVLQIDGGMGTQVLTLANALAANPSSLQFANVIAGQQAEQTITLSHAGGSTAIEIGNATLSPTGEFTLSNNNCPNTLNAGQSCQIRIRFAPNSSSGEESRAVLTISNNTNNPSLGIVMTGTGISASSGDTNDLNSTNGIDSPSSGGGCSLTFSSSQYGTGFSFLMGLFLFGMKRFSLEAK